MEYTNKQLLLNKRPSGMPDDNCWKLNEEKITPLKKNEILIKMYVIARNTLPTFCELHNERHASALSQKLFLNKYLGVLI